jgi:hypothetical protein
VEEPAQGVRGLGVGGVEIEDLSAARIAARSRPTSA